jgi:ribosomal protein S19E (S16A)
MDRKYIQVRSSTLAIKILKGIAITGMVLIAATNPYFGPRMLRALIKEYERKNPKAIKRSMRYLRDRGYVNMTWLPDGRVKVEMTRSGKKIVDQVSIEDMRISKPEQWDRMWRLVIFDVPNKKSKQRLAFTQHLRNVGFQMAQKSVWMFPYPCHKEVMILRKFYHIEEYVIYLETGMVEDDELWRERFSL